MMMKYFKKMREAIKEKFYERFLPNRYKLIKELEYWQHTYDDPSDRFYWRNDLKSIKSMFDVYCHEFNIGKNTFKNKIVIDVGCGPMGPLSLFCAKQKFGVDILAQTYDRHFDLSGHDMIYLSCQSDEIPLLDNFVDVVISRNALDHVDDFEKTIIEIYRILKPGGQIYLSINSKPIAYATEPQILPWQRISAALKGKFKFTKTPTKDRKNVKEGGFTEIWIIKGNKINR
jgi:ubiquinone/menaquinone biosynthesis C-methylase UbiE